MGNFFDDIKDDTGILFDCDFKRILEKAFWDFVTRNGTLNRAQIIGISHDVNQGALTRTRFQIALNSGAVIFCQYQEEYYSHLALAC